MSKTIPELLAYLEELEKRIKAMSKAHTTLELLIEITSYFDTVQTYLRELEDSFETHTTNCEEYATQISNLQEQISTINEKIENLPQTEEFDATEINTKLENLTTNLTNLETKLNSFIGENDTTLDTLVNDISSLQTDVGDIQDQVDSINTEISSINESIGTMQTTITNLTATQNSLSSAQNSMSANINSIDSRLTAAENNISVLTNGIDLGTLEDRIKALESGENLPNYCYHRHYEYNYKPTDYTMYTLLYHYSSNINNKITHNFKLKYESTSTGTLTIEVYHEFDVLFDTITVNLENYPVEYCFSEEFFSTLKSQNVQLKLTASTEITYKSLDLWIYAFNSNIYELDRDLKVCAVDNTIFITKYENGVFKYGKFTSTDDVDLSNLPDQVERIDENGNCVLSVFYAKNFDAMASSYASFEDVYDCVYKALSSRIFEYTNYDDSGTVVQKGSYEKNGLRGELFCDKYAFILDMYSFEDKPGFSRIRMGDERGYEFTNNPGKWLYTTLIRHNNTNYATDIPSVFDYIVEFLSVHEDGNLYYLKHRGSCLKIAKGGNSATAYKQTDGSINVYINYNSHTDKYKLTLNSNSVYEPTFIATIEDCTYVYETYNNQIIKRTSTGWEITELEY